MIIAGIVLLLAIGATVYLTESGGQSTAAPQAPQGNPDDKSLQGLKIQN